MISFRKRANIPYSIHITKIIECRIYENIVMVDEHSLSLQSSVQFLPTRLPRIVLQRVEQVPVVREIMVSAMCLCADKRIILYYSEDLYGPKTKCFLGILCYLSFSVASDFRDDFLYL